MARTKLDLKTVRVPTKASRAAAIKAKHDDLDNLLDAVEIAAYTAAGAISVEKWAAFIDSAVAGQAMSLAVGTVAGQTINLIFRTKTGVGTVVITGTFTGGTTLTFATQGQRAQAIWTGAAWTLRPGYDGVLA